MVLDFDIFRTLRRKIAARDSDRGRMAGLLEGIANGRLTGWVFDPGRPGKRMSVSLVADDGTRRNVRADVYRADLQRAGLGNGHSAFSVPVTRFRGARLVRAFSDDDRFELPGSPAVLAATAPRHADIVTSGSLQFRIDAAPAAGTSVSGWIFDQADPTRRCQIALRVQGQDYGRSRATLYRADLNAIDVDRLHGFQLMFDGLNIGSEDRIELIEADTGATLARLRN